MSAGQGGSYLVPAVNGFVRSIDLGLSAEKKKSGHVQQDILRLLTLWFKYGNRCDVVAAIEDGFNQLSIDTWLNVIPQIIARINMPDDTIRQSVHNLLIRIGQEHPQALVYPLTVQKFSKVSVLVYLSCEVGIILTFENVKRWRASRRPMRACVPPRR
jgi:hypothetical protein